MRPAPIELGRYFMTDLAVKARTDFDPERQLEAKMEEFKVDNTAAAPTENDDNWQVTLVVTQQPAPETNFPYEFRLGLVGYFRCLASDLPPGETEHLVRVNASSMLYGIAREIIRANTERGPWSGVMLPTVSFYYKPEESAATAEGSGE